MISIACGTLPSWITSMIVVQWSGLPMIMRVQAQSKRNLYRYHCSYSLAKVKDVCIVQYGERGTTTTTVTIKLIDEWELRVHAGYACSFLVSTSSNFIWAHCLRFSITIYNSLQLCAIMPWRFVCGSFEIYKSIEKIDLKCFPGHHICWTPTLRIGWGHHPIPQPTPHVSVREVSTPL